MKPIFMIKIGIEDGNAVFRLSFKNEGALFTSSRTITLNSTDLASDIKTKERLGSGIRLFLETELSSVKWPLSNQKKLEDTLSNLDCSVEGLVYNKEMATKFAHIGLIALTCFKEEVTKKGDNLRRPTPLLGVMSSCAERTGGPQDGRGSTP